MEESQTKNSSILSYLWSILMIICISLLTLHLVLLTRSFVGDNKQLIEKTFTIRK